jgi:branched-chain amino acid transport system substrate-binding protein
MSYSPSAVPARLLIAAAVVSLLALSACQRKEGAATPSAAAPASAPGPAQVVRIGHVGPLSGAQAHYGKDNENGVRMALDEINAQGVTLGGRPVRFELAAEDDAGDPRQGTAAAQKMCDQKVAGVVGHLNSGTTIPAARIYADCGIPHITPSASNPALMQPGYKTSFRLIANDDALGAAVATHAADTLKLKKVAVIDDRSAYGQGVADVFRKTAGARGMQVVDQQFTNDKATDFTAILTAIRAKAPDAIFYGGMDPQAGPMLRQMEQLGLGTVRFLGGDGVCTSEIARLSGNAKTLESVICATGGSSLERMPGGAAWKQKYDQRFSGQFQVYSPYAYDATFVLVDAMKRANSADPKVYLPLMAGTDYQGVTARIQFEANGELKNPATTLYTYKGGQKTPLN